MAKITLRLLPLLLCLAARPLLACECAEATVLWIDHEQKHYYVTLDEMTELTVRAKVYDLVGEIQAAQPAWAGAVQLSFLASTASSEPHTPLNDEYIARYDQAGARLIWAPASETPRSSELFVSVPLE